MSVVITVQLPDFTAQRLEELAQDSGLSKTDLIIQGLELIFASRLVEAPSNEFEGFILTNKKLFGRRCSRNARPDVTSCTKCSR